MPNSPAPMAMETSIASSSASRRGPSQRGILGAKSEVYVWVPRQNAWGVGYHSGRRSAGTPRSGVLWHARKNELSNAPVCLMFVILVARHGLSEFAIGRRICEVVDDLADLGCQTVENDLPLAVGLRWNPRYKLGHFNPVCVLDSFPTCADLVAQRFPNVIGSIQQVNTAAESACRLHKRERKLLGIGKSEVDVAMDEPQT